MFGWLSIVRIVLKMTVTTVLTNTDIIQAHYVLVGVIGIEPYIKEDQFRANYNSGSRSSMSNFIEICSELGVKSYGNQTDKPRVGCYCDWCVLAREIRK